MVEITLYKPGYIDLKIQFPENWDELSLPQVEAVSKMMLSGTGDTGEFKASLFISFIRSALKGKKCPKDIIDYLDAEQVAIDGFPLLDFIFSGNGLTVQPYPVIKLNGFFSPKVHGPASDFNDLTCGEFEDAEIFYSLFKSELAAGRADELGDHLAHLAAILYRPLKKGKRQLYNWVSQKGNGYGSYDAEVLYPKFQKLPAYVLYTVFIWYGGCRDRLPLLFPTAFEGAPTEGDTDIIAFTKCIHAAAGPKNGTREQIKLTKLKALFLEMELESIKAKEMKKEYEKA